MGKLTLHIGLHKTGSTTIQEGLYKKRGLALKHGLYYPIYSSNYSRVFYSVFSDHGHNLLINKQAGLDTQEKLAPIKLQSLERLKEQFSDQRAPVTLLSGEGITRLPLLDVDALKSWIEQFYDDISVIAYVRPPCSLLSSMFQQEIRMGQTLETLIQDPPVIEYRARLDPFFKAFGDRMLVKPYFRPLLHNNCIVADLLNHMGFDDSLHSALELDQRNEALSWPATLYLSALNNRLPIYVDGKPNPARQKKLITNARALDGDKFCLPTPYLKQICDTQRDDIQWMEQKLGLSLADIDQQATDDEADIDTVIAARKAEALEKLSCEFHDAQKSLMAQRK